MKQWATVRSNAINDQSGSRAGLTLLELLLVLAILVVVGAFSMPAIEDAYRTRELENAGEEVRQGLASGRTKAVETGIVYQFRFEPGESRYIVVPDPSDISDTDGDSYYRIAGDLGEGMEFRKELEEAGPSEQLEPDWFEGLPGDLSSASWSEPVEFSFEGTAGDAFFYILDDQKRSVRVRIRGLTGGVDVDKVSWEATDQ